MILTVLLHIIFHLVLMGLMAPQGVWVVLVLHPHLGVQILVVMGGVPLLWVVLVVLGLLQQQHALEGCWNHLTLYFLHLQMGHPVVVLIHLPLMGGGLVLVVFLGLDEALLLDEVGGTVGHHLMQVAWGMDAVSLGRGMAS